MPSEIIINRHEDILTATANEQLLACGPRDYVLMDTVTSLPPTFVILVDDSVSPTFKLLVGLDDATNIGSHAFLLTVTLLDYPGVAAVQETVLIDILCPAEPTGFTALSSMPTTSLVYDVHSMEPMSYSLGVWEMVPSACSFTVTSTVMRTLDGTPVDPSWYQIDFANSELVIQMV